MCFLFFISLNNRIITIFVLDLKTPNMNKNYPLIILLFHAINISAQVVDIPDENLKTALLDHNPIIDTNADNEIQLSEAIAYTGYLDVSLIDSTEFEKQISNFTGLDEFVNITGLNAYGHNYYGSFDFSLNTELEELILGSNNFDNLDITANLKLKSLDVSSSSINSLDVSHLTDLEVLNIRHTNFSNIDLSNNLKLKEFTFFASEISSIDLSNNSELERLHTGGSNLTVLDITNNPKLIYLEMQDSTYSSIDLSQNINLETIACYGTEVLSFDFSSNTNLKSFGCGNNLFESLDFSKNTNLERFVSQGNGNLISVNLANGNNANFTYFSANSSPNLETICVDNVEYAVTNFTNIDNSDVFINCNEPVVYIPDTNFKTVLLNNVTINTDGDTEIQVSEALAYSGYLDVSLIESYDFEKQISDFTGIEEFKNITGFNAYGHSYYGSFDFSQNLELEELILGGNNFDNLNISNNLKLKSLDVSTSSISNLDVAHLVDLEVLNIRHTNFSSIDVTNNLKLKEFTFFASEISSIDLSMNIALEDLSTGGAPISNLDITKNINLKDLEIQSSTYDQIDLSKNTALESIACYGSQISSFDFYENPNLESFGCGNNIFESLDFSQNTKLEYLVSQGNDNLKSVNIKNGNNANFRYFSVIDSPSLETFCVDDIEFAVANFTNIDNSDVFIDNFDCNPDLYNTIEGILKINSNNDDCLTGNVVSNSTIYITSANGFSESVTTNQDGYFIRNVPNMDTYIVSVGDPLTNNFITPNDISVTFDTFYNVEEVNFCAESPEETTDLEIIMLPYSEARPGFESYYDIVYRNNGDFTVDGVITLEFNNEILTDFISSHSASNVEPNVIAWTFENLKPSEQRVFFSGFRVLPPPTVNGGETISYTANIFSEETDINPSNNTYELEQLIVNSFDPNDKNVLQGPEILEEQVNDYLDYVIRFENTGTASAINVRITDTLDENLDWSTFEFINSSHDCVTSIDNGNEVEFNFENIMLPFTDEDPVGSNGYVAFRVKPKSDTVLGDIISGTAEIYFDFNLPIITNTVTTEVVEEEILSINSFSKEETTLQIFPNPITKNQFKVNTENIGKIDSIKLFDLTGKEIELNAINVNETEKSFSIPDLTPGVYLLKVNNNVSKLIKK